MGREIHAVFSHWAWLLRGAAPSHGGCGLSWGGRFMQFFHIRRGCLGGQPRHMVGAVCLGAGDSLWCRFSLPGWGRVRVGRGPEGDFGVSVFLGRWFG